MSLVDIISACFGSGSGDSGGSTLRRAPYLDANEAAQLPLDAFVQRSLESAPSALEQSNAFTDIFRKHVDSGAADFARVAHVVQDSLLRLASNDTDRATAQWACQMLALLGEREKSGYHPPGLHGQSYAQVAGADSGEWEKQHRAPPAVIQPPSSHQRSEVYIRTFFFPSEESFSQLIGFLDSAQRTLDICVFNITDNDIARAIVAAKERGVEVRIITDDEQLECRGNDVRRLQEDHGIPFKTDNDPEKFMHNKFAIIDRRAVWTGSYNWTVGARRSNNESAICTNDPAATQAFSGEFEELWSRF
ncbi:phospholipase D/nuclease [Coemansia reversa NRRL 1564]|uniref:Mitochondrial cardiolipin hydrolase n=1 Tax=Coemansia reversa (strain ATCC 12441 / NRRL 1564) TaxID=763665 RepID=A0A2G5BD75_COERN|nr:phospholipase D/nuclease [Coemansia reversa NRRL 1564]|eukprot:PIA16968.1 phospholipase D/nuclease [Coemansia reversa NRRL 1564]